MMRRIRGLAPILAILAATMLALAGPGTRFGLWDFRFGFQLLRWGAYLGIASAGLGILLLFRRPSGASVAAPVLAILLGALAAIVPWQLMRQAGQVPPIHDITTDTDRPPAFVAVLPLRADAPNSAEYEGEAIARQQREAYPDVQPLRLPVDPRTAFDRALTAARQSGWQIVAADSAAGRIEATATTAWFGFKDDVVVRVAPDGGGSRVDVRSVSRVGRSDLGANARRIRDFLARMRA